MNFFKERSPTPQSIWGVYAVIVFLVYSWTLVTSFYQVPSWLFYLTIGQILSIYAYSFVTDLADSLLVLAGVLALEFTIFLALRNKDEFQSRSILMVLVVLGSAMLRLALFQTYVDTEAFLSGELTWWAVTFVLALLVSIFAPRVSLVRKILEGASERVSVFLYIYLPLSLISLLVVLARNIH